MIEIRELHDGEFDVLDTVFEGLSDESRFRRFHAPVRGLTANARRTLAAVDGRRHVAVAAFADGRPVGIARLIADATGVCDLGVEVVDDAQRAGLGARMLREVADLAAAAGHVLVQADVLSTNRAAMRLVLSVFPDAVAFPEGTTTRLVAALPARTSPVACAVPCAA
ncbi:N-acetyltransferase family protein [Pseudonocardia sp.]|uniref:GNAT family N-acetyltransferase n=1 Tax=Pseudonocardia sp. TaxID=60912 RepID=UPI003D1284DE